jgi:hypothetical protein
LLKTPPLPQDVAPMGDFFAQELCSKSENRRFIFEFFEGKWREFEICGGFMSKKNSCFF